MNLNVLLKKLNDEQLTLIAKKNHEYYTSNLRGIGPILNPMKEDREFFKDAIVIDKVIGKATAMLLVLSQVKYIHAIVMSQKAKIVLETYHIDYTYDEIVEYIENRDQTGMCPMEQTVLGIDNLNEAYNALIEKQMQFMKAES